MKDAFAIVAALAVGLLLAQYDRNTDDTAIELGLLLIASIGLALLAPRRWWIIALCVGVPIPIVELAIGHATFPPAGSVALAVTFVGALVGYAIARASKTATA